jgi:hypothetical protein
MHFQKVCPIRTVNNPYFPNRNCGTGVNLRNRAHNPWMPTCRQPFNPADVARRAQYVWNAENNASNQVRMVRRFF